MGEPETVAMRAEAATMMVNDCMLMKNMRTYCDNRGRECMSAKDCASRKVKETEE
jgi:hypothetical protein